MKILFAILLLMLACSNPVETDIEKVAEPDQYWISPLGRTIPVTPKWRRGLPILRGLFRNVTSDTLFNKRMRFIITERDNPDNILSDTFGYMTLDETESKYFPEYPYKIESNLAPDILYHIYAAGDTIDLNITNNWWFSLVADEQ